MELKMKDMFAGVGIGVLFGLLVISLQSQKNDVKPKHGLITDSQQVLIDKLCDGSLTLKCKDGKVIGTKE